MQNDTPGVSLSDDRFDLTFEEAVTVLPDGDDIHTFLNPGVGMMIGADWSRNSVIRALKKAKLRTISGPLARATGHGVAFDDGDRMVFVATDEEKLVALEKAKKKNEA